MISVMKIVREAFEVGTKAAEKFLDELSIFREHAGITFTRRTPWSTQPANMEQSGRYRG